jgi:hypothetical protein
MKNLKKLSYLMALLALSFAMTLTSCDDDDNDDTDTTTENQLTGTITTNTTLVASKKYTLVGNVFVQSGVTLTIEPGTIIFGDKTSKGSLIIDRGATINAAGTADKPIIFTSSAPVGYRNYGDWGGVILLGKAQNNQSASQSIEGISAASGDAGKYGGTADNDNSGTLTYVRIEFAGIALSTDNEINGLTLGSVGSGTTIHHIQVSYSGDDSFEWFGGTVNAQYLVAYRGWDDDFDTDFGYRGKVQYAASFRDPNIADKSGSNGFESDNDGTGTANTPKTSPVFSNVTWFGPYAYAALSGSAASSNYQFGGHLRRNSDIQIYNSVLVGSRFEAVHFDKTGADAMFVGNYIGRSGVSVSKAVKKVTPGNNYDDSSFDADNFIEADQATVDLSSKFAGLSTATSLDINNPSALLANGSSLLSGAKEVPSGVEQTTYIGAFNSSNNWMSGWTSFSPNTNTY